MSERIECECGFFNSVNKDRLYSAEQMNRPYELLVSNGVFATPEGTPSDQLQVWQTDTPSMAVVVRAGRGIFMDKWVINPSAKVLGIPAAEATKKRIDSIIVKVDMTEDVRDAWIEVKKGEPSFDPVAPVMTRTDDIHEYRLADVEVGAGVERITDANIRDTRGMDDCGWVTSLVQQVDTSTLFKQFEAGFYEWFDSVSSVVEHSVGIKAYTNTYVTTADNETEIPIGIDSYNSLTDILHVFVNGMLLVKGTEYTSDTSSVTMVNPLDVGTPVSFIVYKSVDVSGSSDVGSADLEALKTDIANLESEVATTNTDLSALNDVVAVIKAGDGFTGDIDVPGAIRSHGVQIGFSNANNDNVQLGSSACDTLIHGKENITLDARLGTLSLIPVATASYQIGNTSYRYNGIYLVNDPNVSSDERLKTNVEDVDAGEMLDFVNALEVVNYELIADPGVERIGLIAQQVEAVGGSKHVEVSEDGTYGLKPASLVYPLIAAVQRLTERNAELEKRIEALEQNE